MKLLSSDLSSDLLLEDPEEAVEDSFWIGVGPDEVTTAAPDPTDVAAASEGWATAETAATGWVVEGPVVLVGSDDTGWQTGGCKGCEGPCDWDWLGTGAEAPPPGVAEGVCSVFVLFRSGIYSGEVDEST